MKISVKKFIDACILLLGNDFVLTENEKKLPYLIDWRKRYQGLACCVLLPNTVEQIVGIVKYAKKYDVALVPQGGNTGLSGGSTPSGHTTEAIINLKRLSKIRYIDQINQTMAVDAGCVLSDIQKFAEENQLYFPLSLGSEGTCTIGGNLATNAGGVNVIHYGNTRSLCLGLEVVLASGEIWKSMRELEKDNSGYALKEIFIGSEGKLGIITGAVIKLYPKPISISIFVAFSSFEAALHLMQAFRSKICTPLKAFELISNNAISLIEQHYPDYLTALQPGFNSCIKQPYFALIECIVGSEADDDEKIAQNKKYIIDCLSEESASDLLEEVWIAQNDRQSDQFWKIRESIPIAQAKNGLNVKHDISLPISKLEFFIEKITKRLSLSHPGAKIIHFGHLGDGNLHFNVAAPIGEDPAIFLKQQESSINNAVYEEVFQCNGSFSAEHGLGQLKTDLVIQYKSSTEINLMKQLKLAFDPTNLFNPGKL